MAALPDLSVKAGQDNLSTACNGSFRCPYSFCRFFKIADAVHVHHRRMRNITQGAVCVSVFQDQQNDGVNDEEVSPYMGLGVGMNQKAKPMKPSALAVV